MTRADPPDRSSQELNDLQRWRAWALRLVMLVAAVSGLPAYLSVLANVLISGRGTTLLLVYSAAYAAFVALGFLHGLGVSLRAWIFLSLAYAIAVASLARIGLAGSGRLYLVFIPATAAILIGGRAGYICLGISLAIYAGFTILVGVGVAARWIQPVSPVGLAFWIEAGVALAVFVVTTTVLLERFTTAHERTLAASGGVTAELERAYEALQQRVQDRTRELQLLNSVAAVASGQVDRGELLRLSLEKTMDAFAIEAGGAYGLDEDTLVMLACKGLSEEFALQMGRLPLMDALAGKDLKLDQPLFWPAGEYPDRPLKHFMEKEGLKLIIGVPLVARGKMVGGLVLNSRRERLFTAEESSLLVAVGQQIGLAIENARLLESERDRREEANRRREVAEGLRDILAVLNSNRPLQETLNFIIGQACRLMRCDAAAMLQLEAPEGPLKIRASCGLDSGYVAAVQFALGKGAAGKALAGRQPFTLPDALEFLAPPQGESNLPDPEERRMLELMIAQGFRAVLSVPLIVQDKGDGGITLYYRTPRRFSDEEVRLATGIGSQAALAIQNARLRAQAEQSAAFAERNRLARELHDSVTQSLYSVTLYAEASARLLQGGQTAQAADHLRELGTTARDALREMRLLIFELSPPALETGSLADAIQIRLDAVEARGGMPVQFEVEGEEGLSPRVRQELYQIAQEALNNALKHSHAQSVKILLRFGASETVLAISDDGVGFDLEQAQKSGGLGLRGMRERVERIGGVLAVDSAQAGGTRLSVTVPAKG